MNGRSSTALAKVERHLSVFAEDPNWQRIWLNLESQSWHSLAVVPAGERSSIELVHALAAVAWHQRSTPVIVADLRNLNLAGLAAARSEIRRRVEVGERVLIGMNSINGNPTSSAVAREADRVILCVHLGLTLRSQLKQTIRELGTQNCLGSILFGLKKR